MTKVLIAELKDKKVETPEITPIRTEIKEAADKLVVMSGIATLEANQRFLAVRIKDLEQTLNEFLDMVVTQFEQVIGHNFAAPFKAHLKKLADKYDLLPDVNAVLDKANIALDKNVKQNNNIVTPNNKPVTIETIEPDTF